MDKIKISKKRKTSSSRIQKPKHTKAKMNKKLLESEKNLVLRESSDLEEYDPVTNLLDMNKMGAAIMQCFIEDDTEGVLEIIENYLYAQNKTQFLKNAKVPRSTAYNFFRRRNPTIKTLAKILHASAKRPNL